MAESIIKKQPLPIMELWSGTWSSGDLTVSGAGAYTLFMFVTAGSPMIVVRNGATLRGISATATSANQYIRAFAGTINGDVFSMTQSNEIAHNPNSNHAGMASQAVTKIVGLL